MRARSLGTNTELDPVHELMRAEARSMHLERLLTATLQVLYDLSLLCASIGGLTAAKAKKLLKAKMQEMPGGYRVARHLAQLDARLGFPLADKGVPLACWIAERTRNGARPQKR